MRLRYRLYALSVCLVLASCLSTVKGEKHKHFWDGARISRNARFVFPHDRSLTSPSRLKTPARLG